MRFSFAGARQQPIDRNSLVVLNQFFGDNLAPHGDTIRWTYTVPANRRAQIQSSLSGTRRTTAAGALGESTAYVEVDAVVALTNAWSRDNNVGAIAKSELGVSAFLSAGMVLRGRTFSGDTGGTIDYITNATVMEFDA